MKALSIGRDMSCDIVLHDNTDVISRRHAILNITSSGKMTIVDQSRNGTYVNGIKISANVPVPVTRKDVISFAHVSQLDWNLVGIDDGFLDRHPLLGESLSAFRWRCRLLSRSKLEQSGLRFTRNFAWA